MKHVLLLEPDRVIAGCVVEEMSIHNIRVHAATNADAAIALADKFTPDAVISELSLPGHSGSEFLYEFRTYIDWQDIPLFIYSSIKPSLVITESKDWGLLNVQQFFYKPESTLQDVASAVESTVG